MQQLVTLLHSRCIFIYHRFFLSFDFYYIARVLTLEAEFEAIVWQKLMCRCDFVAIDGNDTLANCLDCRQSGIVRFNNRMLGNPVRLGSVVTSLLTSSK